jgi:pyroglutamyl-peptidase
MHILLTGFTPFQGVEVNPSQFIIERSEREDVLARLLLTEYDAAGAEIVRLLNKTNPDAVVCLGVAQTRETICLERIALNLDDTLTPDNTSVVRSGQPIVPDAPLAYASTLPLEAMRDAIAAKDIPVSISNHAGAFVCNHVFYVTRHALQMSGSSIPCGFVHVPALLDGSGKGLSLDTMIEAVDISLAVLRERMSLSVR